MKKLLPVVASSLLLIIGIISKADAKQLSSVKREILGDISSEQFELTSAIELREIFDVTDLRPFFPVSGEPEIFKGRLFTQLNIGETFIANRTTDADFDDYVSLLTNGKKNNIGFFLKAIPPDSGLGQGGLESLLTGDENKIDFFGNTIESISFQIDKLVITPSSLVNPFTPFTVNLETTWTVHGEPIPESSNVLGLLAVSTFAIGLVKRQS